MTVHVSNRHNGNDHSVYSSSNTSTWEVYIGRPGVERLSSEFKANLG